MRAPGLLAVAAWTALAGCGADDDTALGPCETRCDGNLGTTIIVQVPSERLETPVTIELNPCIDRGYLPDGAPVVVVLAGSFRATVTPVERHEHAVEGRSGIVVLYPSFPTDQGDFVSERAGDYRGTGARWATEAALRYAASTVEDTDGCSLADRIAPPLSSQPPWLHGQSNGGNLAIAVLADPELDLPELSGLTTFETPAGPQFVTVELGSTSNPLPIYEPGSCSWDAEAGLTCAMDYSQLDWAPEATDAEGHQGVAYFDLDEDGAYNEDQDSPVWGVRPVVDEQPWLLCSLSLNQALRDAGHEPQGLQSVEATEAFWASRDASRLVGDAIARWPELPFTVIGTEDDHILGIEDHAHITGLAHALQQSGARWVRVNPDRAYLVRGMGEHLDWADNPANQPTSPGDTELAMLPNASELGLHARDFATASLLELMERRWCGAWSDDLDHVLLP